MLPVEDGQTGEGPVIEQAGNGLTVTVKEQTLLALVPPLVTLLLTVNVYEPALSAATVTLELVVDPTIVAVLPPV